MDSNFWLILLCFVYLMATLANMAMISANVRLLRRVDALKNPDNTEQSPDWTHDTLILFITGLMWPFISIGFLVICFFPPQPKNLSKSNENDQSK